MMQLVIVILYKIASVAAVTFIHVLLRLETSSTVPLCAELVSKIFRDCDPRHVIPNGRHLKSLQRMGIGKQSELPDLSNAKF